MAQILSWQVLRQCAARRLLRFGRGFDSRGHCRRGGCQPLRLVGLHCLERQLELLGLARQLLRGTAKLGPPVTRQLEFQPGDLGLGSERVLRHRGNEALQGSEVIGQIVGRDRHARNGADRQLNVPVKPWVESICRSLC
jgi:hypothetical protein